jgi:multidrug efflux pump subunit AcrA (membrane-fusion protein)
MGKKPLFDKIVTIILISICIGLAAILANNLLKANSQNSQKPMQQSNSQTSTINVSVEQATVGTFTKTTTFGSEIESSFDTVSLTSPLVGGKLTSLTIKEGDILEAGSIIGTVDPSTAGNQYKATPITAAIAGTVFSVDSYIGQQITTSTVLATLGNAGKLQIVAHLSERYLATVHVGSKATFVTAAWPDESMGATVESISPSINASNRTFEITLSLDKEDSRLKEGMYVKLDLVTEDLDNCITIATDAINSYLGEPVVYVVEDGKAKRVAITTTSSDDNKSVVTSGLTGTEQVIVAGSVVDGSSVKIIGEQL